MAAPARTPSPRGERTRCAILASAERLFAARGFDATRLEDVAEAVGIRRASIVYYYRDKRALYDAVLGEVLEALRTTIAQALGEPGPAPQRIEAAVGAWLDFLAERPTFGRLLLREMAGAASVPALARHLDPFFELVRAFQAEQARKGGALPDAIDPAHFASAIAGASVFYSTALPSLVPALRDAPDAVSASSEHRRVVLSLTRRLMGVRENRLQLAPEPRMESEEAPP